MHKTVWSKSISLLFMAASMVRADSVLLNAGSNLVSFRYAFADPSPGTVFAGVLGRVVFIGSYQAGAWQMYYPPSAGYPSFVNTLTSIQPGRGYFVQLTSGSQVTLNYSGSIPTSNTQRDLQPGWNLIGFLNDADRFWANLIGPGALFVQKIRGICNGTTFFGFNLDSTPFAKDANNNGMLDKDEVRWFYASDSLCTSLLPPLRQLSSGLGYWVQTSAPISVGPQLALWMPSDVSGDDANCSMIEDLNGNGVFDYGYSIWNGSAYATNPYDCNRVVKATQDTVLFRVPVGATFASIPLIEQQISVANVGDRGNPQVYGYGGNDSLSFSIGLSSGLSNWLQVSPLSGTVTTQQDVATIKLKARLDAIPAGTTATGTLTFMSNGGTKVMTVKAIAPLLGGTYDGSTFSWLGNTATETSTLIRQKHVMRIVFNGSTGTIQKAYTPHLEGDVPLTVTNTGTIGFTASGTLSVAANDPKNKFGVAYQRAFSFQGVRQNDDASTAFGAQPPLQGTYTETISGLGPNSILWSGRFLLLQRSEP